MRRRAGPPKAAAPASVPSRLQVLHQLHLHAVRRFQIDNPMRELIGLRAEQPADAPFVSGPVDEVAGGGPPRGRFGPKTKGTLLLVRRGPVLVRPPPPPAPKPTPPPPPPRTLPPPEHGGGA